jgi:hypothetical protein
LNVKCGDDILVSHSKFASFKFQLACRYVPVMTPKNRFFNFWDPVLIVCLIFTAIVTPVEVAFLRWGAVQGSNPAHPALETAWLQTLEPAP